MPQNHVSIVSYTKEDACITLLVRSKRWAFYLPHSRYHRMVEEVSVWVRRGWFNWTVSQLLANAEEVRSMDGTSNRRLYSTADETALAQIQEAMGMSVDYRSEPSVEYPFTLIAPKAKGVTYNGTRRWFKTADDARTFAQEIYDGETKTFELCVVKCDDVVKPKPKTELVSTWSKTESA